MKKWTGQFSAKPEAFEEWLPKEGDGVQITLYIDCWFPWWKRWWYVLARRFLHRPWPQELLAYVPHAVVNTQNQTTNEDGSSTINVSWTTDGVMHNDKEIS